MTLEDYKDLYEKLQLVIKNQEERIIRLETTLKDFQKRHSINNINAYNRWVDSLHD